MKPSFEKLVPDTDQSFRCFDRRSLTSPLKWHLHPEIELTYVDTGSGSRLVGDHIGEYADHDLVLLGSNLPHTWNSDEFREEKYDRHAAIVTQFHPEFLGVDFFAAKEFGLVRQLLANASRGLWFPPTEAKSIGKKVKQMLVRSGAARLLSLIEILHELSLSKHTQQLASKSYERPASKEAETRIQTVCDYIQLNFDDHELSASHLAELLYMNASAFSRFFKQATGRTPSGYINELRIGYACRQLIDSDKPVLKICLDSGFSSASYFNRTFRLLRNMTPRQYRTQHSKLGDSK